MGAVESNKKWGGTICEDTVNILIFIILLNNKIDCQSKIDVFRFALEKFFHYTSKKVRSVFA